MIYGYRVAGFKSERRPASVRNDGRHQIVTAADIKSEYPAGMNRNPQHTPEGSPIPPNTAAKLRREMARLHQIKEQIKQIEAERLERIKRAPEEKTHAMILLLAQVLGLGIETADMLVREALSRPLRDRRAVARLAGLTGSPDESGSKRREKGLARAGAARLRTGMIQLACAC